MNSIYCTAEQAQSVLLQMRDRGLRIADPIAEYQNGEATTYYYDTRRAQYVCQLIDVVAGSYVKNEPLSKESLTDRLMRMALAELIKQGFQVEPAS